MIIFAGCTRFRRHLPPAGRAKKGFSQREAANKRHDQQAGAWSPTRELDDKSGYELSMSGRQQDHPQAPVPRGEPGEQGKPGEPGCSRPGW